MKTQIETVIDGLSGGGPTLCGRILRTARSAARLAVIGGATLSMGPGPAAAISAEPEAPTAQADAPAAANQSEWPLVFSEDFESGAQRWEPVEHDGWRVEKDDTGNHFYHQFRKESDYKPEHRSPFHQALVKDLSVGSFRLEARVRSTHPDYGHRDACLFFARQSPARLYYVHFGKATDDHANQIFIVNDAPRTKISTVTTSGTPWDDAWHQVRIVRDVERGTIDVYFDDMERPAMRAVDKTFEMGQVGVGSFDDTSAWDDVRVYAPKGP